MDGQGAFTYRCAVREPNRLCLAPSNSMTSVADLVYEQVKTLPEPLAREVLDFAGFLGERAERASWRDLMNAQALSLADVWDNVEDAVWDDIPAR